MSQCNGFNMANWQIYGGRLEKQGGQSAAGPDIVSISTLKILTGSILEVALEDGKDVSDKWEKKKKNSSQEREIKSI